MDVHKRLLLRNITVKPLPQITNQMVTACKAYVTSGGTETIWTQKAPEVIQKLNDCRLLNQEYQKCFRKTKQKLEEMPQERKFDFSEMYIFGKFDMFTRRLGKIISMFETIETYSHLAESKIEGVDRPLNTCLFHLVSCAVIVDNDRLEPLILGMELMANKFSVIVTSMKKKPYDYLDQRKADFDQDFEEFKRQINDLHVSGVLIAIII